MSYVLREHNFRASSIWRQASQFLKLDPPLTMALVFLAGFGLVVLYSASAGDADVLIRQGLRLTVGFVVMLLLAQIHAQQLRMWSPWFYLCGVLMLMAVLVFGDSGKGAQRWLDLGLLRFQPSELLKIGVPMAMAWFLAERAVPPTLLRTLMAAVITLIPCALIARQPDLGTSILVASAGFFVLFLAGMRWRWIISLLVLFTAMAPVSWHYLHAYQRDRVLTFLNPENDPLGTGYHIIQSKIAVGSGGIYGKGWLNGTQSKLDFLPERSTDFIFAVFGEEFGLTGAILLVFLYAFIVLRGLFISFNAQDMYERLLAGSLSLTFFVYLFVNIGMVIGLLPVVGVPLPLISYGGTSMVTLMAGFGILMSINSHRRLMAY